MKTARRICPRCSFTFSDNATKAKPDACPECGVNFDAFDKVNSLVKTGNDTTSDVSWLKRYWLKLAAVIAFIGVAATLLLENRDAFSGFILLCGSSYFIVKLLLHKTAKRLPGVLELELNSLSGFTERMIGSDGNAALAFDEQREEVCLLKNKGGFASKRIVAYRDIMSSEIFEDGTSVTKTLRGSQLGGYVVGSLVLGPTGAVIGALTGKKETSREINRVELRLTVNDATSPLHDITFLNLEDKSSRITYAVAIKWARHWHGIMEVLIKRGNDEERIQKTVLAEAPKQLRNLSVADEIKKLVDLHQSGVLTHDEFQGQKKKLLEGQT